MKDIVIIGAGPAGLTFAYELLNAENDYNITILEGENRVGGLSASYVFDGNIVDVGGHRFFTKNEKIENIWHELLCHDFEEVGRSSHILYEENYYEYPLKMSLKILKQFGWKKSFSVICDFIHSALFPRKVGTLEDYYINQFGEELYNTFFKEYTMKLWGIDAKELSPDWGRQRVNNISLFSVFVKGLFGKLMNKRTLIQSFEYPKRGCIQMWDAMAAAIERKGGCVELGQRVESIRYENNIWQLTCNGSRDVYKADVLISSMPLKELVLRSNCFSEMARKIAQKLEYRSMIIAAIAYNQQYTGTKWKCIREDQWVYIQQSSCIFGRVQVLNNWSKALVADDENILLEMEIFCDENDTVWNTEESELQEMCIHDLQKLDYVSSEIVTDSWMVRKIKDAYPVYNEGYKQIGMICDEVNEIEGLYCIGRNGQHKYNNMDHSMECAINTVQILKNNHRKAGMWDVNTDSGYIEK